jgi:hypothetical protein
VPPISRSCRLAFGPEAVRTLERQQACSGAARL